MAHFRCQVCSRVLEFTGSSESLSFLQHSIYNSGIGASTRLDESFVVLPNTKAKRVGAHATQTPSSASSIYCAGVAGAASSMEGSFVVLPPTKFAPQSGSPQLSSATLAANTNSQTSTSSPPVAKPAIDHFTTLSRIFDLASQSTQIDHPMCPDCCQQLQTKLDQQVLESEEEVELYRACLSNLQLEEQQEAEISGQVDTAIEKMKQVERELLKEIDELEGQMRGLEEERGRLEEEEHRQDRARDAYFHNFNNFHLQLQTHMEERDAVLAAIESSNEALRVLGPTSTFNDAFHIWMDGPFATINNFRLGRLPTVQVEWDEINAAWGQACLLLHTMAQACKLTFSSYRILPMGSHPRIADKKNIYELFGPVNPFWSSKYDKAMVCFLACLQEFADFAKARDIAYEVNPPFELAHKVEQDKIDGKTIQYSFNKDEKWTAALKLMLSNLKGLLTWLTKNDPLL